MQIVGQHATQTIFINGLKLEKGFSPYALSKCSNGFGWGPGSDLSGKLLAFVLIDREFRTSIAKKYHEALSREFVSSLPEGDFEIVFDVKKWVQDKLEKE